MSFTYNSLSQAIVLETGLGVGTGIMLGWAGNVSQARTATIFALRDVTLCVVSACIWNPINRLAFRVVMNTLTMLGLKNQNVLTGPATAVLAGDTAWGMLALYNEWPPYNWGQIR